MSTPSSVGIISCNNDTIINNAVNYFDTTSMNSNGSSSSDDDDDDDETDRAPDITESLVSLYDGNKQSFGTTEDSCSVQQQHVGDRNKSNSKLYKRIGLYVSIVLLLLVGSTVVISTLSYVALIWMKYVNENYLYKQLIALEFTEKRSATEMTYYQRICGTDSNLNPNSSKDEKISIDVSTQNPNDLVLSTTASVNDAIQHQMQHGFTVFQSVLSPSTIHDLREHINYKNYHDESLYVIEQKHRFSILISSTTPIVAQALEELANHPQFAPAMEGILGSNPAMIELTAISSSAGAVDQWWHDDTNYQQGAMQYVNSFRPLYSVFIQLQDTTASMGATNVCPGTHYCSEGPLAYMCQHSGFPMVLNHTNPPVTRRHNATNKVEHHVPYWKAGDAVLMNMDSIHRGAAHTDDDAVDRIMLILSFVPKSLDRAEYRQMTNGITWQIQYDMWGHTLNDLKTATTTMQQPWVTLKSFGLLDYHNKGWGVDFFAANSQRYMNQDNGYSYGEYADWIKKDGGLRWLPRWLHGTGDDYYPYYMDTLKVVTKFIKTCLVTTSIVYLILFILLCPTKQRHFVPTAPTAVGPITQKGSNRLRRSIMLSLVAIVQLGLIGLSATSLYYYAIHYVNNTGWAIDLVKNRRFAPIVQYEIDYFIKDVDPNLYYLSGYDKKQHIADTAADQARPVTTVVTADDRVSRKLTVPTRDDVLVETKFGSKNLHMFTNFMNYHPGNVQFNQLLNSMQMTLALQQKPTHFQMELIQHVIATTINENNGRFLYQFPNGGWTKMKLDEIITFIIREILKQSNTIRATVHTEIRHIRTDNNMFGLHRSSKMTIDHMIPYLRNLERTILPVSASIPSTTMTKQSNNNIFFPLQSRNKMMIRPLMTTSTSKVTTKSQLFNFPTKTIGQEPYDGAWIEEGDVIETFYEKMWYPAVVSNISPKGEYEVQFPTGDETAVLDQYKIASLKPLQINEVIGVWNKELDDDPTGDIHFDKTIVKAIVSTNNMTGVTTYQGLRSDGSSVTFTTLDTVRPASYRKRRPKPDRFAAFQAVEAIDDADEEEEEDDDEEDEKEDDDDDDEETDYE